MLDLTKVKLKNLQPSQFYISEEKLNNIQQWFSADDLSNFRPIPVKVIDESIVILDGHTRCVAAILAGLDRLPLEFDSDELDWDMYKYCVNECQIQNIMSPYDLLSRIISKEDYNLKWNDWCDNVQAEIIKRRASSKM